MAALRSAMQRGCDRFGFRLTQFSIQTNHAHLLCEAKDKDVLSKGLRGLVIRMAKALNRTLKRAGAVWADRYHARILRTPREVRSAVSYVLGNWRHHGGDRYPRLSIDPCTSAAWFEGYRERLLPPSAGAPPPVAAARSWLLTRGWRVHGLLSVADGPWSADA